MTNQEKIELVKHLFSEQGVPLPENEKELINIYDDLMAENESKSKLPVRKDLNFHPSIRYSKNELGYQHTRLGTYFKTIKFSDGTSWAIAKSALISRSYSGYPDGGFLAPQPEYHKLVYAPESSLKNSFKNVKGIRLKQDNSGLRAWSKSSKYDRHKRTKEKRLLSQPIQKVRPPKPNRKTKKANIYGGTEKSSTALVGKAVNPSVSLQTRLYKDENGEEFSLLIKGSFIEQQFYKSGKTGFVMQAYYVSDENSDVDFIPKNFNWEDISLNDPFLKAINKLKKSLTENKHESDQLRNSLLQPEIEKPEYKPEEKKNDTKKRNKKKRKQNRQNRQIKKLKEQGKQVKFNLVGKL